MFGKRIAALGLAAAISACTCIAASAEENKVELIVSDGYKISKELTSELFVTADDALISIKYVDGAFVTATILDDIDSAFDKAWFNSCIDSFTAEDGEYTIIEGSCRLDGEIHYEYRAIVERDGVYTVEECDYIPDTITEGCDTAGYEYTLTIYDNYGNVTDTIPVDADFDTTATLSTFTTNGEEWNIAESTAKLRFIDDKYALVQTELYEHYDDEVRVNYANVTDIKLINLETKEVMHIDNDAIWAFKDNYANIQDMNIIMSSYKFPDEQVAITLGQMVASGYACLLIDMATCELVLEPCADLATADDGKTYLIAHLDDDCNAYVDSEGNKLFELDEGCIATAFSGEYAAVAQNGEIYLIDRNMNVASTTIAKGGEIEDMGVLDDGVYWFDVLDKNFERNSYFIAYDSTENDVEETPPNTDDTTTGSDEGNDTTSDVPADEVTGNDDTASDNKDEEANTDDNAGSTDGADDNNKTSAETGAAGVAGAAALAVTAIGAVVLSRRKK